METSAYGSRPAFGTLFGVRRSDAGALRKSGQFFVRLCSSVTSSTAFLEASMDTTTVRSGPLLTMSCGGGNVPVPAMNHLMHGFSLASDRVSLLFVLYFVTDTR